MNFKIESVMEGKCEKSGMQISLYFMRRGREFMEISYVIVQTLSCSISVADTQMHIWLVREKEEHLVLC